MDYKQVTKSRAVGRTEKPLTDEQIIGIIGKPGVSGASSWATRENTLAVMLHGDDKRKQRKRAARAELKAWTQAGVPMNPDYARSLITAAELPMPPHLIKHELKPDESEFLKYMAQQIYAGFGVPAELLKGKDGNHATKE
jgi:hypothetical protein